MHETQLNRSHCSFFLSGLALLVSCSLFLGCSSGGQSEKAVGTVTITITSGGQPVTPGRVELVTDRPAEGSGGELDASGVTRIAGVIVGEYTVTVLPPIVVQAPGETVKKPDESLFPQKFRTLQTSPLKIHVDEGHNEATFDLKEAK